MRCPVLVGRDDELSLLTRLVDRAQEGQGGLAFVLGEPGIGKSRLIGAVADVARSRRMAVLRGRATASPAPVPYRPLAEAFLSAFRTREVDASRFGGLRPALPLILPGLVPAEAEPDRSVMLVGEAALALAEQCAEPGGAVVALEDLHWADAETCEVLDYLSDKLDSVPVAVMASVRTGEGSQAERLAASLGGRRLADHLVLRRLAPDAVETVMATALGTTSIAPRLRTTVAEASGGVPLLVEEFLASLIDAEALRREGDSWVASDRVPALVPPSFAAVVEERLARLSEGARTVVSAAAVVGEQIDQRLVAAITGLDVAAAVDALREVARVQLVDEARGEPSSTFRFHHGLGRTAVLERLPEAERRRLAAAALAAIGEGDTPRRGENADLVAQLALAAGDTGRAAGAFIDAARGACAKGAFQSARHAAELAVDLSTSAQQRVQAREALLTVLVQAGDPVRAAAVGAALLDDLARIDAAATRLAAVRLRLAEAAIAATDWGTAERHLDEAASASGESPELALDVNLLRAATLLGRHLADEAVEQASRAMAGSRERHDDLRVAEAAMLLGRARRVTDPDAAASAFLEARAAAERAGSAVAIARAAHELATIDVLHAGPPDRMEQARRLAEEAGLLALATACDFHLAVLHWLRFELDESRLYGTRARDGAIRWQLGVLAPSAATMAGSVDALRGREVESVEVFQRYLPMMDAEIEATSRGHMLALLALALEDRPRALDELDRAADLAPRYSDVARAPHCGMRALLLAAEGDERAGDVARALDADRAVVGVARGLLDLALAVLDARHGNAGGAVHRTERGLERLAPTPWFRAMGARLVAEAAADGGWGDPTRWLREAYDFFEAARIPAPAEACRRLLHRTGARAPRPPADGEHPELARLGVTPREAEVLFLVAAGLSNRDVADRLVLSVRTVEKHVERLMTKTGAANRTQLAALATRLAGPAPSPT